MPAHQRIWRNEGVQLQQRSTSHPVVQIQDRTRLPCCMVVEVQQPSEPRATAYLSAT
jgi:hypothetical protein